MFYNDYIHFVVIFISPAAEHKSIIISGTRSDAELNGMADRLVDRIMDVMLRNMKGEE